jgi:arabinan endo-1,5-alpha-L-arabinosidase
VECTLRRWHCALELRLVACLNLVGLSAFALAPRPGQGTAGMLALDGDLSPVHDPVMIKEKDTYYAFCTGGRNGSGVLPIRISKDLKTWTRTGFVFPDRLPEWTKTEIPRANNAWAPDIARHNGKYLFYYSVSSFGSRDSAIGLVTNTTLDPSSPECRWIDEGMVVRSFQDKDDWNAIDANLFVEDERHQAIVADGARDLILFHAYPAQGRGSSLFISTMIWEDGWPRVGVLPG